MRQQFTSNSFITLPSHLSALLVLILSFVLTACGGNSERSSSSAALSYDAEAPELLEFGAVNKCNNQPVIAEDDVIAINLKASESILAPIAVINGEEFQMTGQHNSWSLDHTLTNVAGLQHDKTIPLKIKFKDNSGKSGSDTELSAESELKFCSVNCQCFPESIEGVWKNANRINAMGVGPSSGNTEYWRVDDFELSRRACQFDDTYTFRKDEAFQPGGGTFDQEMDNNTWLEGWASPNGQESCGDPTVLVDYPWDGLETGHSYIWNPQDGELSVLGEGAHIGLPRITNGGDASTDGPASIVTYTVETASYCDINLNILANGDLWWHFELERVSFPNPDNANEQFSIVDYPGYCTQGPALLDPSLNDGSGADAGAGGNTDAGAGDDSGSAATAEFSEAFGDASYDAETSVYTFPTGAQPWAGFANMNADLYPLIFSEAGSISFTGSVADGGSVDVRFRLEFKPHPDVDPAYDTETVTVSGSDDATYTVAVPSQGENTFSSLIMYVVTQDKAVTVTNVVVEADADSGSGNDADAGTGAGAGGTDITVPSDNDNELLSGNWTLAQTGSAVAVGPSLGNTSWWPGSDAASVFEERSCMFDDVYSFNSGTNSFTKDIQDATWIDPWQGADAASCGSPVAPYDGSVASGYAYDADAGTLTLYGKGAHIGLGMVTNGAEIGNVADAPDSITYTVTELTNSSMTLDIPVVTSTGTDAFWRFQLVCADDSCVGNNDEGTTVVGEVGGTASFTGVFDGFLANAETNTFEWPTDAADWAGVANENAALYPIVVPENTQINFLASSAEPVSVYFRLEFNPYPDINPLYETERVVVDGDCQVYSVNLPSQGSNTFSSYLLFLEDRDTPVTVSNVVIGGDLPECPAPATETPLNIQESSVPAGLTFTGLDCVISTVEGEIDNCATASPEDGVQAVFISESLSVIVPEATNDDGEVIPAYGEKTFKFGLASENINTTGTGFTIHFDSSVLSVKEVTNVFEGAIAAGSESFEVESNDDGDPLTDKYLAFGWASLFGEFPGAPTVELATITFTHDLVEPTSEVEGTPGSDDSATDDSADTPATDDSTSDDSADTPATDDSASDDSAETPATDDSATDDSAETPATDDSTSDDSADTPATDDSATDDSAETPATDDSATDDSAETPATDDSTSDDSAETPGSDDSATDDSAEIPVTDDSADTPASVETVISVPEQAASTQHVYVSASELSEDGSQVTVTLSYKADEANTTGIGFSLGFDSSVLTLNNVSDVFAGAIASGSLNSEGDALDFGWASLFGQFPGSNEAELATVTFDIADGATGSTGISIDVNSSAAGFSFDGQSQQIAVVESEVDSTDSTDSSDSLEPIETVISVPEQASNTQHIYVSDSQLSEDGSQVSVTLSYKSDNPNTTGAGFSVGFNSSILSLNNVSDVFSGAIASGNLNADGNALDFGWASLFGQFPGSNEAVLATVTFDIDPSATDYAQLELVGTSNQAGMDYELQSQQIAVVAPVVE